MTFTPAEIDYLEGQSLGRLCTLGPGGEPQARPVGVHLGPDGTIDVPGYHNAESQKWRNVLRDPRVTFVVDDIASRTPWRVRGIEIRGEAEALLGVGSTEGGLSGDVIRIRPKRILSWGIDSERLQARDVG
ncbi:pyridoxamine 5'-phosphate oxidase family protein [Saccharopolyspora kobensis]|uniref:Pyridoxamine 5'-phosphate oxidase family protein n=1 Tax=Saccharopolyspora kobensis TaxID=146035 RepID=A0A1H6C3M8_9PSEU|nr:PPOX class F420-dependent oxidoreductase [Saccharopolyspora kobensis]SEG67235.1 pyridoxamine 5'-phosphate oxidase family protein [Saccharopolyspora kobensis]SFC25299.1 pyridoxamine 5'-phosphate oxidase family protein [Saccharopolyspora kobensis]